MSEIELKPVTDVTVVAWRIVDSFTAWEAACLLMDYEPPLKLYHYTVLPNWVEKLARELIKYPHDGGDTWNGWVFRPLQGHSIRVPHQEMPATFTREILRRVATELELRPKFLNDMESAKQPREQKPELSAEAQPNTLKRKDAKSGSTETEAVQPSEAGDGEIPPHLAGTGFWKWAIALWLDLKMPKTRAFWLALKKYRNKDGSPITEWSGDELQWRMETNGLTKPLSKATFGNHMTEVRAHYLPKKRVKP
jgi:hypothetical protein